MTDKELRKLSRLDLITIIYELQKQNESMAKELNERAVILEEAGSIAEASLKLNKVFETAQNAADQYLVSVKAANDNINEKLKRTDEWCRQMIQLTEEDCAERCLEAEREIESKMKEFRNQVKNILTSNPELAAKMKKDRNTQGENEE